MSKPDHIKQQVVQEFFAWKGLILLENNKTGFFCFSRAGEAANISKLCFNFTVEAAWKTVLTLNRPGESGIRLQARSPLCCAETVSSRKLKLCDFYYILISFHFEYKPVLWDIHCCHGSTIVEEWFV